MPRLLPLLVLLLVSSAAASSGTQAQGAGPGAPSRRGLVPVAPSEAELGAMALGLNDTRRRLGGSFQLCAPCTCCGGDRHTCVLAPCCYAINCNIPNRPFGYCSFMPKSCDCLGCNL
ncbi:hypothetical protein PAHAL_5G043600 [Panicum hallii]|uniref:DUF7866 domain-containing protein n=1 Tax=Panicum hallii TaxID=206008 RepID=A0A2S3HNQ0_9POAL|nr:uncharacterized protein LOC112894400 [Panicum hallii]PAN26863.1 hypothetical protein PAHAL_5G043600 [Panicum hallii]